MKRKKIELTRKQLIIISIVFIASLCLAYYLLTRDNNPFRFEYEDNVFIGEMEGVDYDALLAMLQEKTDRSAIAFSINSRPTVVVNVMNIMIMNPEGNNKTITIALHDNETGEVIYQSKGIAEGSFIRYITLNKTYPPGQYEITAYISGFDTEDYQLLGIAAAGLTINVVQ
jgi:hypothetical protein